MSPIPLGILALAGAAAGGSYELIESNILSSNALSITFSSIPADYKHLQIRGMVRGTGGNQDFFRMRFNSDTGSNYAFHRLKGDGYSITSGNATSQVYIEPIQRIRGTSSNLYNETAFITDILDYSSTNKYTTTRTIGGAPQANSGDPEEVQINSGLWMNTAAVSSIQIYTNLSSSLAANSRFSLYGIRG